MHMKFIYFFTVATILLIACKKEVEPNKGEDLKGYSSQGNLLVFEVADTFVKAYEFDIEPYQPWDSMPIRTTYYEYVDSLSTYIGWFEVKNWNSIGYFSPNFDVNAPFAGEFFPRFMDDWHGCTVIPTEELIANETQSNLPNSKFSEYYQNLSPEILEAWDKVNNFRVTLQYRYETPTSQVGVFKKTTMNLGTRYYFFLAKY